MPAQRPLDEWNTEVSEFLSPEQRLDAIAEILATISLRALKVSHEADSPTSPQND